MFFKNVKENDPVNKLTAALACSDAEERRSLFFSAMYDIVEWAEQAGIEGDAVSAHICAVLGAEDNILGRICELGGTLRGTLEIVSAQAAWDMSMMLRDIIELVKRSSFRSLLHYRPQRALGYARDSAIVGAKRMARDLLLAQTPRAALASLVRFYSAHGSGIFAFAEAFRYDRESGFVPVRSRDMTALSSLVGYESNKARIIANTELFIEGGEANNVLLFGDSGTGKSTTVRALLNERDFAKRGLRIIEISKDHMRDIPHAVDQLRGRRHRFILFMDDLSFEEFETDYKYLKAAIEGGVEGRPQNVLVYATSNRRNLVREVWADRKAAADDVHGRDTMQEKLSLADRFGLAIWYGPLSKDEYVRAVLSYARRAGVCTDDEALAARALAWQIERGGFTGRTAQQFVLSLSAAETNI